MDHTLGKESEGQTAQPAGPKYLGAEPNAKANKTRPEFKIPTTPQTVLRDRANIPVMRFTPTAWAKLVFMRDLGDTEVGGFGICPNEPLLVEDFQTVEQICNSAHVEFLDEALANYFEDQVLAGRQPSQFARIWIHTHPGNSAGPSSEDEQTFRRVFSDPDWAVMFILAKGGDVSARLRINTGPGAEVPLPVVIDWNTTFPSPDRDAWLLEYQASVWKEGYSWSNSNWGDNYPHGGYQGGYQQGYNRGGSSHTHSGGTTGTAVPSIAGGAVRTRVNPYGSISVLGEDGDDYHPHAPADTTRRSTAPGKRHQRIPEVVRTGQRNRLLNAGDADSQGGELTKAELDAIRQENSKWDSDKEAWERRKANSGTTPPVAQQPSGNDNHRNQQSAQDYYDDAGLNID